MNARGHSTVDSDVQCPICDEEYSSSIASTAQHSDDHTPIILTCCGKTICATCFERHRASKVANLTGRETMIQCMMCNRLYNSENDAPYIRGRIAVDPEEYFELLKKVKHQSAASFACQRGLLEQLSTSTDTTDSEGDDSEFIETVDGGGRGLVEEARLFLNKAARQAVAIFSRQWDREQLSASTDTTDSEEDDSETIEIVDPGGRVLVEGAGFEIINGVYEPSGTFDGVCTYSKEIVWEGRMMSVSLFRCTASNNRRWWDISGSPTDQQPGTRVDADFYTAPVADDEIATPPIGGWVKVGVGVEPPPRVTWKSNENTVRWKWWWKP